MKLVVVQFSVIALILFVTLFFYGNAREAKGFSEAENECSVSALEYQTEQTEKALEASLSHTKESIEAILNKQNRMTEARSLHEKSNNQINKSSDGTLAPVLREQLERMRENDNGL